MVWRRLRLLEQGTVCMIFTLLDGSLSATNEIYLLTNLVLFCVPNETNSAPKVH